MADDVVEDWVRRLAEAAQTPLIEDGEADDVLDLTRVIAHTAERRLAPLTAYLVGLALGAEGAVSEPETRRNRIREVSALTRRLATEAAQAPQAHADEPREREPGEDS